MYGDHSYSNIIIHEGANVRLGNIAEAREDTEEEKFNTWYTTLYYNDIHHREENIAEPYTGTLEWLLDVPSAFNVKNQASTNSLSHGASEGANAYDRLWDRIEDKARIAYWLRSDGNAPVFWVSGKPGSGKSTLVKFLTNHERCLRELGAWSHSHKLFVLSHFFWATGTNYQCNISGLLRSLIWQFFDRGTKAGFDLWQSSFNGARSTVWSIKALENAIDLILGQSNWYFCIFIDALDECEDQGRTKLIEIIALWAKRPNVKICVSSRPEWAFERSYQSNPRLKVEDVTSNDMRAHCLGVLTSANNNGNGESPHLSQTDIDELVSMLVWKAEGVFLWLKVVLGWLREGIESRDSFGLLSSTLDMMPDDIIELYEHMLSRRSDNFQRYKKFFCQIITVVLDVKDRMVIPSATLLDIAFATNREAVTRFMTSDMDETAISSLCQQFAFRDLLVWIKARGQLFVAVDLSDVTLEDRVAPDAEEDSLALPCGEAKYYRNAELQIARAGCTNVRLIHKTVATFFNDSIQARKWLENSELTKADLDLIYLERQLFGFLLECAMIRRIRGRLDLEDLKSIVTGRHNDYEADSKTHTTVAGRRVLHAFLSAKALRTHLLEELNRTYYELVSKKCHPRSGARSRYVYACCLKWFQEANPTIDVSRLRLQ